MIVFNPEVGQPLSGLAAAQHRVQDFMEKFGQDTPEKPTRLPTQTAVLRRRLILEEAMEVHRCLVEGDFLGTVDNLCDLIYVALGTAAAMGVDLEPCFQIIHEDNMSKVSGTKDKHGKWVKPAGHVGPGAALTEELIKQGWLQE